MTHHDSEKVDLFSHHKVFLTTTLNGSNDDLNNVQPHLSEIFILSLVIF